MDKTLDVRDLTAPKRQPVILGTLDELEPGETVMLINDHDPEPLSYKLQSEHPGEYRWEYLQQGPDEWKVKITRK